MKGYLKNKITLFIGFITFYTGITYLLLKFNKNKFAYVVMGHRISSENPFSFEGCSPKYFEKSLSILVNHFDFISLSDFYRHIEDGIPLKRKTIILTFDDGFRDNYSNAFPILKKYDIPAIIYLVHDCIENHSLPWSQALGFLLKNTKEHFFSIKNKEINFSFDLSTDRQKEITFNNISKIFQKSTRENRELLLEQIKERSKLELPNDMMLTWEMVDEMRQSNIEFGGHTMSHPLLAKIEIQEAKQEISKSKELIEKRLGEKLIHFAFPAGSYNKELKDYIKRINYKTSYNKKKPDEDLNFRNTHFTKPHNIRRIGLHESPHFVIIAEFAGIYNFFRKIKKLI